MSNNPFQKNITASKGSARKWDMKTDSEISARECEHCGAPRPVNTDIAKCSYCGSRFMDIEVIIKRNNDE